MSQYLAQKVRSMKFSFRSIVMFAILSLMLFFLVKASLEIYRIFAYEQQREEILKEQKAFARFTLRSYPTLPFEDTLPEKEKQALLFSLLLLEANPEGLSQLEMLYYAHDLPLLFFPEDAQKHDYPDSLSLSELYTAYRTRIDNIGEKSAYVEREDLVSKPDNFSASTLHQSMVISDFQMRDEESPFLLYPLKFYFPTSYYPADPYVPYIVEDALKTARRFESEKGFKSELAMFTGDLTDNGHYNEVRWGITSMDGGLLHPDSGKDDDIYSGRFGNGEPNDIADSFYAKGMEGTPWYFVPGNHDGLAMGVFALTYEPLDLLVTKLINGTYGFMNTISVGEINYLGNIPNLRSMFRYWFSNKPFQKVVPDPDRRLLNSVDIARQMFVTDGFPKGHGMELTKDIENDRSFSFVSTKPEQAFAIRYIALDTNAIHLQGEFPDNKMQWLQEELDASLRNRELVIMSSHHKPLDIIDNGDELVELLNTYPNVIAHQVAHWHRNGMIARVGETEELGYWEIETASMVNWPQQLRMLDISIDLDQGIGVIENTMINHSNDNPWALSERGRFLAYLEAWLHEGEEKLVSREGLPEMRNTRLYFKLPTTFIESH